MSLSNYPRRDNSFGIDMDKRDSLSDKIVKIADDISPKPAISKHDVKEFIKELKENLRAKHIDSTFPMETQMIYFYEILNEIDELAGPELTEE